MNTPLIAGVSAEKLAVRTALLFAALSLASFGLYILLYFVLPWNAALMSVLAPLFGTLYAPALWAGFSVSQSDYPLLESAVFALIENFVLAVLIAWVSLWLASRKRSHAKELP